MFATLHTKFMKMSQVAVWVGGFALMCSAFMVTGDVIARKLFGVTISGADEISGYIFAASTTWAYAYCLLHRAHIRIDAFYNLLGQRPRAFLDLLGLLLLLYYIYLLTAGGIEMFLDNVKFNSSAQTTLATPLWIPQIFWVSGLCFFLLTLVFLTLYCFAALFRGEWSTIGRIAGVKSVEEEISEETHV